MHLFTDEDHLRAELATCEVIDQQVTSAKESYLPCSRETRALIRKLYCEHLAYFSAGNDPQSLKWAHRTRKRLLALRLAELLEPHTHGHELTKEVHDGI